MLRRDASGDFRDEDRASPSIYGYFAQILIGFFHKNPGCRWIDGVEKLPDIGVVDGP
jgi:hypothetical protein